LIVRSPLIFAITPVVLLMLAASCAKDEPSRKLADVASAESASVSAKAEAAARVDVTPSMGGSVFFVGGHPVELAVYADGRVDGQVYDERGQEVAPERVTELTATLSVMGEAKPRVALRWNGAIKRFSGQAAEAGELVAQPIDVTLQIDGKALTGALETYALLPADARLAASADARLPTANSNAQAKLGADAKVLADAKALRLKAPSVAAKVRAKGDAKVALPKPKVGVSAKASTGTEKRKAGAGASLEAKASFGLGN
jgi:hypothetical protein